MFKADRITPDGNAGASGHASRSSSSGLAVWVLASLLLSAFACDDPLSVDDPDIARPDDLQGEAGLNARRLGAFGDFAVAYSGSDGSAGQILYSGAFADEFIITGPFAERSQIDARQVTTSNRFIPGFYANLHRARRAAESSAAAWSKADTLAQAPDVLAEMNSLAGFTYVFFGENFCSGVPFSQVTESGEFQHGTGSTSVEMYETAIARFDEALGSAQEANRADLERLARVGKARALVNLGEFIQAADVSASVPTDWEFTIKHSTNSDRQVNGVVEFTNFNERWSVANNEGGGIGFRDAFDAGDPRTPYVVAPDSAALVPEFVGFHQLKYPQRSSPVPLASGVEARLIEAEAALQRDDAPTFEGIHNDLRERLDAAAVGPIDADTMSQEQMLEIHFRERALWLWLTGHRHGDQRRLIRQYGLTEDEVFPVGPYHKSEFGNYGDEVVIPVPIEERNNPNFSGQQPLCIDRNA